MTNVSDRSFQALTSWYFLDPGGWRELHDIAAELPSRSDIRRRIEAVLDRVQRDTEGSFGLARWHEDDCYQGVAWALGVKGWRLDDR